MNKMSFCRSSNYPSISLFFFSLIFFTVSCSHGPTNTKSKPKDDLNFTITTDNQESARPGGTVIFSVHVNKISDDSLTGVFVRWKTKSNNIKLERQDPNTVVAFIPRNFTKNQLTVEADISKISNSHSQNENSKTKTVTIKDNPLSIEKMQGFINSDTTWAKEKVYKLTKDISLKNGAILTIKNGATLDLNGHAISSENGMLNLNGTSAKKVKLIVGKGLNERIESKLRANFVQILSSRNEVGIAVLGKSTISNSKIYGHFVVNKCSISNSKISRLSHLGILANGRNLGPYSINLKNTSIYEFYINKIVEGANLSAEESKIFILNFDFLKNAHIEHLNTNFTGNNISYLSISGDNDGKQTIFKKNYISRLLINGNLSASIHQNNIGILQAGFYKKNEEPFWNPSWGKSFKKLNGPVVKINTSGQFKVQKFNLSDNFWAPEILKEMNKKGSGKNISFIYDYYDNSSLDKIIYKNWADTKF